MATPNLGLEIPIAGSGGWTIKLDGNRLILDTAVGTKLNADGSFKDPLTVEGATTFGKTVALGNALIDLLKMINIDVAHNDPIECRYLLYGVNTATIASTDPDSMTTGLCAEAQSTHNIGQYRYLDGGIFHAYMKGTGDVHAATAVVGFTANENTGLLGYGCGMSIGVNNMGGGTITEANGIYARVYNSGAGTMTEGYAAWLRADNDIGASMPTGVGLQVEMKNKGNVTDFYGLRIDRWTNTGVIGTSYGIYLDNSIDVGTTHYAIYSASASDSYFGGAIQVNDKLTANELRMLERAADPAEPAEGEAVIWMSDGTGKGDDGDVLIASKVGGVTHWTTLFDHSGGAAW